MEKQNKYLVVWLALLLPIIFIAFYSSYFIFIPNFPKDISGMIHLHTLVALVWVFMLIVQPVLIRKRKILLHQNIGKASYVIFPLFVITSAVLIGNLIQSEFARFAAIPIGETSIMVGCYSLAIYFKNRPKLHARFMIGTALVLLGPTLGRILPSLLSNWSSLQRENFKTAIIEGLLLTLLALDWKWKADYRPYLIMGVAWFTHHLCYNWVLAG